MLACLRRSHGRSQSQAPRCYVAAASALALSSLPHRRDCSSERHHLPSAQATTRHGAARSPSTSGATAVVSGDLQARFFSQVPGCKFDSLPDPSAPSRGEAVAGAGFSALMPLPRTCSGLMLKRIFGRARRLAVAVVNATERIVWRSSQGTRCRRPPGCAWLASSTPSDKQTAVRLQRRGEREGSQEG